MENEFKPFYPKKPDSRYIKPKKCRDIPDKLLKYKNAELLANEILIDQDSRHFVILDGTFIFGDFIEALCVVKNYHVKEMLISTLSLSVENVESLRNLIAGNYVESLSLVVSDYFFSHERNNLIKLLYQRLDIGDKFQLSSASTHCKICQFETFCGLKIVIHGSANLRSSSNIEQIVIEESKELYNFNYEIHKSISEKYKTINKSLRNKQLWQAVVTEKIEGND